MEKGQNPSDREQIGAKGRSSALETLVETLRFYGVSDEDAKAEKILEYRAMLEARRDWGSLVSRSLQDKWDAVVCESLAVAAESRRSARQSVADIGAGGGLLGIPFAIARPDAMVTLVESLSRKATFLAEVAGHLALANVHVRNERAEAMSGKSEYDGIISRAAGKLYELAPLALDMLAPRGLYIALKASSVDDEIIEARAAIESSQGGLVEVRSVDYPPGVAKGSGASLVVIEKL